MQAQPEFGVKELFSHVIGDMAKAISERSGEGKPEQFVRARAAAAMIVDLQPRDVLEVMLAGHCVMFHELMNDSIHDTLRGELDTMRRGTRSNILGMNKAFHNNLDRLDRYQTRLFEDRADAPAAQVLQAESAPPAPPPAEPAAPSPEPPPLEVPPPSESPANIPLAAQKVAIQPGAAQYRRLQAATETRQPGPPVLGNSGDTALAASRGTATPTPSFATG